MIFPTINYLLNIFTDTVWQFYIFHKLVFTHIYSQEGNVCFSLKAVFKLWKRPNITLPIFYWKRNLVIARIRFIDQRDYMYMWIYITLIRTVDVNALEKFIYVYRHNNMATMI